MEVEMSHHTQIETVRTVDLDHEQLLVLDDRRGTRARVLFGGAWLTEQGRLDDRFARAGDELQLTQRGRAVLESVGRSRVELVQRAPRHGARLGGWLAARLAGRRLPLLRGVAGLVSLVLALGLPDLLARGFQRGAEHVADAAAAPARVQRS
jgi:hypothetical protein